MTFTWYAFLFLAVLLGSRAKSVESEDKSWVGKRVMGKKENFELLAQAKPDAKVVAMIQGSYLPVESEDGEWIRVRCCGMAGWIQRADAVLLDDAVRYFTERIRLDEKDVPAYVLRALARMDRGEYDNAINDLNAATRLDAKHVSAVLFRGGCWLEKGEYEKALKDFDQAIRIDPKNAFAFTNRGSYWAEKMEWDKAIKDLDEATRLDPTDALAFSNRAACWKFKKEFDRAIKDYDQAIHLVSDFPEAFLGRANCWDQKREYPKAIADYEEAARLNPEDWPAYQLLAWLLATCPDGTCRNGKKAVQLAKKACDLSAWKIGENIAVLAVACAEAGDFENAIRYQKKALDIPEYEKKYGAFAIERIKEFEDGKAYHRK